MISQEVKSLEETSSKFYEDDVVVIDLDSVTHVIKTSGIFYVITTAGVRLELSSDRGKRLLERWASRNRRER